MNAVADRLEERIEKTPITFHRDDVYIAELFGFEVKRFAHNYCRMRAAGDRYYRQIPRYLSDTDAAMSLVPDNFGLTLFFNRPQHAMPNGCEAVLYMPGEDEYFTGFSTVPARAIISALLRANSPPSKSDG